MTTNLNLAPNLPPLPRRVRAPVLETLGALFVAYSASFLQIAISSTYLGRNIVEPFFLLGLLLICYSCRTIRELFSRVIHSSRFLFLTGGLFAFGALGFFTGLQYVGPIDAAIAVYSDGRSIFIFFFLWFCAQTEGSALIEIDRVVTKIFIFLTVFEVVSVWKFGGGGMYLDTMEYSRMTILAVAPMFLVIRFLVAKRVLFAYGALLASLYIGVVALMRLNYLFVAIGVFAIVLFSIKYLKSGIGFFRSALLVLGIFAGITILPMKIVDYLEENPIRMIHGMNRLTALFEGEDMEETRQGNLYVLASEPEEFVIPQGFGTKAHTPRIMSEFRQKYGVLSSVDSNIFYCCYHFGLLFGVILFVYIIGSIIKSAFQSTTFGILSVGAIFAVALGISLLAMFFLKAWIFTYFSSALPYGLFLFWIFRAREFNSLYGVIYGNR